MSWTEATLIRSGFGTKFAPDEGFLTSWSSDGNAFSMVVGARTVSNVEVLIQIDARSRINAEVDNTLDLMLSEASAPMLELQVVEWSDLAARTVLSVPADMDCFGEGYELEISWSLADDTVEHPEPLPATVMRASSGQYLYQGREITKSAAPLFPPDDLQVPAVGVDQLFLTDDGDGRPQFCRFGSLWNVASPPKPSCSLVFSMGEIHEDDGSTLKILAPGSSTYWEFDYTESAPSLVLSFSLDRGGIIDYWHSYFSRVAGDG